MKQTKAIVIGELSIKHLLEMKNLLLLCCCLLQSTLFAQSWRESITAKDYCLLSFRISEANQYPVVFNVAIENADTIRLDTRTMDDLIESVFAEGYYVPETYHGFLPTFFNIWGKTANTETECSMFVQNFFEMLDRYGESFSMKLDSGEDLSISYVRITGFTIVCNTEHSFSIGIDSKDYPNTEKTIIPISIVNCFKPEGYRIIVDKEVLGPQ